MTGIVPTPSAPTVPIYPALGSANFNQEAYTYGTSMPAVSYRIWEIGKASETNATAAKEQAEAATESRGQSEAARDAAVEAQGLAEDARDAAVTAKGQAQAARDDSVTAKGQSEAARDASQTARGGSEAARDASVTAKGQSEAARDAAEDFRDQAEAFATKQLVASSTTSVTPGAGAKSFTIEASRSFVVGMYLVATSASDPNTRMSGYVQSYNGTSGALVIAVDAFAGASAKADWVIGVGAPGALSSGLPRQIVTTNTVCVANVAYIVAAAGITLTLPTTWAAGDRIAIVEAIGGWQQYTQDWGSTPVRGRTLGSQTIDALYGSTGELVYQDTTRGVV